MSRREENQAARATLWNIICQGQFVFVVKEVMYSISQHRQAEGGGKSDPA